MECPNCRHFNPKKATVCELCHVTLQLETELASAQLAGPAQEKSLRRAGQCKQCGEINAAGATKCVRCGASMARPRLNLRKGTGGGLVIRSRLASTYLICPPLSPILLEEGEQYSIGRSEDNVISLPGDLVSRAHSMIRSEDGVWYLEDLGSSNGTFKNGRRLTERAELEDGDEIVIGGFHMGVQVKRGRLTTDKVAYPDVQERATVMLSADELVGAGEAPPAEELKAALEGKLDQVPLAQVLQFLSMSARTGELAVSSDDCGWGSISFAAGEIAAAWASGSGGGELQGREALLHLARARQGEFAFQSSEEGAPRQITEPTAALIEEVTRAAADSGD